MIRELFGNQQGDAWHEHRKGRVTASRMKDLMAVSKVKGKEGEPLKARFDYRDELLAERLTNHLQQHYVSPQMQWGSETENEAKMRYEQATGDMLIPVGFILHPDYDWAGASPDSLLEDAVYECKCPETTTFLEWLINGTTPQEYIDQMQWQMRCADKPRAVFHAYDPRLTAEDKRSIIRIVERDDERIAKLEAEAVKMNAEIEAMIAELGLPPTAWNVKGDEVIHSPRYEGELAITDADLDRYIPL